MQLPEDKEKHNDWPGLVQPQSHKPISVECPPRDGGPRGLNWAMWAMHLWFLTQCMYGKIGMENKFPNPKYSN